MSRDRHAVERFLFREARLLDERRWDEWLDLWADDATYTVPISATTGCTDLDWSEAGDLYYVDEPKPVLQARVAKLQTGTAWAEAPPSRVVRMIGNVDVDAFDDRYVVHSNFTLHRSRRERVTEVYSGARLDRLRPAGDSFLIERREVRLCSDVLVSANLELFF